MMKLQFVVLNHLRKQDARNGHLHPQGHILVILLRLIGILISTACDER